MKTKVVKVGYGKVTKVKIPNKTDINEMAKNHLKFFIVFNILIS